MNTERPSPSGIEQYRSLQILDELSNNDSLTQRDLSSRLGIALGLVNSYVKNLVKKGYVTVKAIPPKRYTYYLTPKGFTEKTRLTFHLLQDYTRIYREAKNNLKKVFKEMQNNGMQKVIFAGTDEVADIAYITLQETKMEFSGVVDDGNAGKKFFNSEIKPFSKIKDMKYDCILITSYAQKDVIYKELLKSGIAKNTIWVVFPG